MITSLHLRPRRARRGVIALAAALVVVVTGAGAALACWTTSGAGSGVGSTGSPVALTTTATTASSSALVPGVAGDLRIAITNPNTVAVVVSAVALDSARPVGVSGSSGTCSAPPLTVSATTTISVAAQQTVIVTVPAAVTLGASTPSGCQGAQLTVPVVLTGRTA